MISDKGNKTFLYRINWILGDREKHPWGRSLGLRNSRIDSIFKGVPPQVDGLERIRRGERVNLDWLISGEGAPFVVPIFRDDAACAAALAERLADGGDYRLYVLASPLEAAVVLTLPVVLDYEDGTSASFTDVLFFLPAGELTLAEAGRWRDRHLVSVGADVLAKLRSGHMGPRDMLGSKGTRGLLERARPATTAEIGRVAEEAAAYQAGPSEEGALVGHFRRLPPRQRGAVLEVVRGLDREDDPAE